jgi:hypothetical protein
VEAKLKMWRWRGWSDLVRKIDTGKMEEWIVMYVLADVAVAVVVVVVVVVVELSSWSTS